MKKNVSHLKIPEWVEITEVKVGQVGSCKNDHCSQPWPQGHSRAEGSVRDEIGRKGHDIGLWSSPASAWPEHHVWNHGGWTRPAKIRSPRLTTNSCFRKWCPNSRITDTPTWFKNSSKMVNATITPIPPHWDTTLNSGWLKTQAPPKDNENTSSFSRHKIGFAFYFSWLKSVYLQ